MSNFERAILVGVCFCENEVNSLRRIGLFSMNIQETNKTVRDAAMVQMQVILRSITAKLFEFFEFYNKVSSRKRESDAVLKVLDRMKPQHKACVKHVGYSYARKIRNSQANHYKLEDIEETVARVDGSAKCEFSLTPETGNAFFPFAERLVFNPDPDHRLDTEIEAKEAESIVGDWIDWILLSSAFVFAFRDELFKEFIKSHKVSIRGRKLAEFVAEDLKVPMTFKLPLFIRSYE